jgi:hypothetical protein
MLPATAAAVQHGLASMNTNCKQTETSAKSHDMDLLKFGCQM